MGIKNKLLKNKKNMVIMIAGILCIIICSRYVIRRIWEAERIKEWREGYLSETKKVDEKVKVGAYTFNLKNVYYDSETKSGYCYIEVKSNKKDIRDLSFTDDSYGRIVNKREETQFRIKINNKDHCQQRFDIRINGDTLCILVFFEDSYDRTEGSIYISTDYPKDEEKIDIRAEKLSHKYTGEDNIEARLTPYVIKINKGLDRNLNSLSIVYKNGKEKIYIKDGNMAGKAISRGNSEHTWCFFNNYVDYDKIDYILVNGKKLKEDLETNE